MIIRVLKYVWALPTTALGLVFVPLALVTGGALQIVDGVFEVHGGVVRFLLQHCTFLKGGASSLTLGHVVLGRNLMMLELTREHERVHVRQCERWGPLFLPAYGVASLIAVARGGNIYLDNCFEREAFESTKG